MKPILPKGFLYFPEFLTKQEESDPPEKISKIDLHTFTFQGYEAKRKVANFGYDYNFEKSRLTKGEPIPPAFHPLIEKVSDSLAVATSDFTELLIIKYPIGVVINCHRDDPPFELITGKSLLSDCTFRLRPYDKKKQSRSSTISFSMQRRSLYILQGPARTDWHHSISPVKGLRYSITLRTLRKDRKNSP